MNPQREDPRMQTTHELIHGPTGSGKTYAVRQLLADEARAEHVETWIVDPHVALPQFARTADKYAAPMSEIRTLMRDLAAETRDRTEKLAQVGAAEFQAGDPRHGLPLIVVTVEEASQVLADREVCALMERVIQQARKTGVLVRLTVNSKEKPTLLRDFGFSEVIRSTAATGRVVSCKKASA